MSFCAHCGAPVVERAAFCSACGKPPTGAAPRPAAVSSGSSAAMIVLVVIVAGFVLVAVIGILAAIAIPNLITATERSKQKRTMAGMRSLATAIEAYAVDSNVYPSSESVAELEPILAPTYIRELPRVDGWGEPFRYECRPASGDPSDPCDSYNLASGGRDRTFESSDYSSTSPTGTNGFDCDIVFADGFFVRYPDGMQ